MDIPAARKRVRSQNFTVTEQQLLYKTIVPFLNIVENKKTDCVNQSQKHDAWKEIVQLYNSQTPSVPRTLENLQYAFKNTKTRIKKQQSEAKMLVEDPSKKKKFLEALDENGRDWTAVSKQTEETPEVCQETFDILKTGVKKADGAYKRKLMGTGGGPPPSYDDDDDSAYNIIKKNLEPQLDGLYTMYDGDADLMEQYIKTLPQKDRITPIELRTDAADFIENVETSFESQPAWNCQPILLAENHIDQQVIEVTHSENQIEQPVIAAAQSENHTVKSRIDTIRKKNDPALNSPPIEKKKKEAKKKMSDVNEYICTVSELKQQLLSKQLVIAEEQFKEVQLNIEHKNILYQLEQEDAVKKNKFNEEFRKKQLLLLQLQIDNYDK